MLQYLPLHHFFLLGLKLAFFIISEYVYFTCYIFFDTPILSALYNFNYYFLNLHMHLSLFYTIHKISYNNSIDHGNGSNSTIYIIALNFSNNFINNSINNSSFSIPNKSIMSFIMSSIIIYITLSFIN